MIQAMAVKTATTTALGWLVALFHEYRAKPTNTIHIRTAVRSCTRVAPLSVAGSKEPSLMMSVNNAMTRLANKKQMDTDNLYVSFYIQCQIGITLRAE